MLQEMSHIPHHDLDRVLNRQKPPGLTHCSSKPDILSRPLASLILVSSDPKEKVAQGLYRRYVFRAAKESTDLPFSGPDLTTCLPPYSKSSRIYIAFEKRKARKNEPHTQLASSEHSSLLLFIFLLLNDLSPESAIITIHPKLNARGYRSTICELQT